MKINFDYQLVDGEDLPAKDEKGANATVLQALKRAILASEERDGKLERFELFMKLKAATAETEFSVQEVALLDKAIAVYPVLIFGQLSYLLSNKQTQ
jgi:hypothetical protein